MEKWHHAGTSGRKRRLPQKSGHRAFQPAAPDIARAIGLPPAEAVRLLTRRQWREGDVAALQAVAERLGLDVPLEGLAP